jgi:hypothetical protein
MIADGRVTTPHEMRVLDEEGAGDAFRVKSKFAAGNGGAQRCLDLHVVCSPREFLPDVVENDMN